MAASPDVIVVGAGIVGAACAWELAHAGVRVHVLEATPTTAGGTTAAGMGHLIVTDDSEAQFRLCRWSQTLWNELAERLPTTAQLDRCGCIWVAADAEEAELVETKAAFYAERGVTVEILDETALRAAEPELRSGLPAGLLMTEDSVIYPPVAAAWLLDDAVAVGATVQRRAPVRRVEPGAVTLHDGQRWTAAAVVNCAGHDALALLPTAVPGLQIRPRKGHLAISARVPGFCHHQVAELGYFRSANTHTASSVAFNVQPRVTGQVLIGSSRQYGEVDSRVDPAILARMLDRAAEYLPRLPEVPIIRTWTGFRAATEDKLPAIGAVQGDARLILAAGHEGLGITTSLGTGRLVADLFLGRTSAIDPAPYRLERFEAAA